MPPLPMSVPVYGVAIQTGLYPPPSGYPPPSFAMPPPAPAPEYRPAPEPTVEVDLGPEELAAVKKGRAGRVVFALLLFVAAGGAAAAVLAPPPLPPPLGPRRA